MAVQFTEYSNHYEGCGKRNNESLCFISFQSMSGNHEAFQSNHSSHLSLIKFSAVSTDLRRKKDTACLVFQHFESFKQYCRWEYGHKCILFFIISLWILKRKMQCRFWHLKIFWSPWKTKKWDKTEHTKNILFFADEIYVKHGFHFWLTVYRWLHLQCWNAVTCCNILKSRFRIFIIWVSKQIGNWDKKGKHLPIWGKDRSTFVFVT